MPATHGGRQGERPGALLHDGAGARAHHRRAQQVRNHVISCLPPGIAPDNDTISASPLQKAEAHSRLVDISRCRPGFLQYDAANGMF